MMHREEKIEVVYRTLDWMDANPAKTTTGAPARDAHGKQCRPYREEAKCFCFLGRLIVEAGPDEGLTTNGALNRWFHDLHMSPRVVAYLNDKYSSARHRLPALRQFFDRHTGKGKEST